MNYLKRYQDMIRLRGLTSNTVRSYSTYISAYLDYVSEHLNRRPSQVTWQQKRDFIEWIQLFWPPASAVAPFVCLYAVTGLWISPINYVPL